MKKATLEKVQARLAAYVKVSAKEPVLIVSEGEPVAMIVGLAANGKRTPRKLRDVLRRAWQEYEQNGGIPHDQFWKELAKETSRA